MEDMFRDGDPMEPADGGAMLEDESAEPQVDVIRGLLELIDAPNVVDIVSEDEDGAARLSKISDTVIDEFDIDEASREEWLDRARDGLKLASMVTEGKSYPWEGAANVKFPLIASAALQFWSRAFPAVVPPGEIVRGVIHGRDRKGAKAARKERVTEYMSYTLRKRVPGWKGQKSALMMQLPIVGHLFTKVWHDPAMGVVRTKLCTPDSVVVNNATRTLEEAPRISEILWLTPNEIAERERDGRFTKMEYGGFTGGKRENAENETDKSGADAGTDSLAPQEFIEQHRWLDLDEDGYAEPYVVTVHRESRKVVRIVANFRADDVRITAGGHADTLAAAAALVNAAEQAQGMMSQAVQFNGHLAMDPRAMQLIQAARQMQDAQVLSIKRRDFFTDYKFFPAFDGSYYGIGLGFLLTHTSDAINSLCNMLLDGGHLSSLGAGFLGSGPNLKRGNLRFRPGEWKTVNVGGAVLRDAMVPVQFPQPSPVLFQMLGLLIDAGRELGNIREVLQGNTPGGAQVQPTTLMALIQQGMAVFSASIQQIFESMGREFNMIALCMADYPDEERYAAFHDDGDAETEDHAVSGPAQMAARQVQPGQPPQPQPSKISMAEDFAFEDMDIEPVADPRAVTNVQQMGQAQILMEMARAGDLPKAQVIRRVLEAAGVAGIDELMPEPDPAMMKLQQQREQLIEQITMKKIGADIAEIEARTEERKASAKLKGAQAQTEVTQQIENMADAEAADESQTIGHAMSARGAALDAEERRVRLAMDQLRLIDEMMTNDHTRRTGGLAGARNDQGGFSRASSPGRGPSTPDISALLGQGGANPGGEPGAPVGPGANVYPGVDPGF